MRKKSIKFNNFYYDLIIKINFRSSRMVCMLPLIKYHDMKSPVLSIAVFTGKYVFLLTTLFKYKLSMILKEFTCKCYFFWQVFPRNRHSIEKEVGSRRVIFSSIAWKLGRDVFFLLSFDQVSISYFRRTSWLSLDQKLACKSESNSTASGHSFPFYLIGYINFINRQF